MYVTVSLKIDLEATASLSEMESQIQEAGREVMKAALKQALRQSDEYHMICPACRSQQTSTQGTKRRVLLTSFGRVEVALRRQRCQACGQRFRPAERCLAQGGRARAQEEHQDPPEWLQVGLDWGWIPSREHKGGQDQQDWGDRQSGRRSGQTWATLIEPTTVCGHVWAS